MSALAEKLSEIGPAPEKVVPGPANRCFPVYGAGDLDDFRAVKSLHDSGYVWKQVQEHVDGVMGVENPIPTDKFVYHWRRQCTCWKPSERDRS